MRKTFKKILILLLIILSTLFFLNTNTVEAINLDSYKPSGTGNPTVLKSKVENVLGAIQVIGSIVSVIALIVIGIKYMIGSVEEKAEYKKSLLPYIIGALLLFATSNLVQVLYDIGQKINQ